MKKEANETQQLVNKKTNKNIVFYIVIGIIVIVLVGVILAFVITSNSPAKRLQEQLDLGENYLSELNYEQAIASYEMAIEIEPMSVEAYMGLASVYEAQGDYDKAISVLEDGYAVTEDEKLKQQLEKINSLLAVNEETIEEMFSDTDSADSVPVIIRSEGTSYNSEGELTGTSVIEYHPNGEKASIISYKDEEVVSEEYYNDEGNIMRAVIPYDNYFIEEVIYNGTKGWSSTTEIKRIFHYTDGNSVVVCEGILDADGKIVSSNTFNMEDGNLQSSYVNEYDTHNNLVQIYEVDIITQERSLSRVYYYDDNGNVTKVLLYNIDGTLFKNEVYVYNEENQEIERIFYDGEENVLYRCVTEYNERGQVSCQKSYYYDSVGNVNGFSWQETEFDEYGYLSRINHYDQDDNLTGYDIYTNFYP